MIVLETSAAMPQARGLMRLTLESEGDIASISLVAEDVRTEERGEWKTSMTEGRQGLSCFMDGKPFKLSSGKLPLAYIISGPTAQEGVETVRQSVTAFKVVVEVQAKIDRSTAWEKGDKSRDFCVVSLVRVVEVWSSATKCLWSEKMAGNGHVKASATLSANGRIEKPELTPASRL